MRASAKQLIVIGNGMAAIRFLEELQSQPVCHYQVTVFGEEPHVGYNRILLSPLLSGEQTLDKVITHSHEWYQERNIELTTGRRITAIDPEQKTVTDCQGHSHVYDELIIATGSRPFLPELAGTDLNGVYTYRTIDDVEAMQNASETASHAVVIGGGLLGLEVACGLKAQGLDVTVCHRHTVLMENQLDATASGHLSTILANKGVRLITNANTVKLEGNRRVNTVVLEDGTRLAADIVVFAVGIQPEISLAHSAGIVCQRGILVNDHMQTSNASIYALGECAEHQNKTYGLVAPLYEQAAICARYLCGEQSAAYHGSVNATGLKVTGVHLFSAGQFNEDQECKTMRLNDAGNLLYRKLVFKDRRLVGALLFGDISGSSWYQGLIESGQSLDNIDPLMIQGEPLVDKEMPADNDISLPEASVA